MLVLAAALVQLALLQARQQPLQRQQALAAAKRLKLGVRGRVGQGATGVAAPQHLLVRLAQALARLQHLVVARACMQSQQAWQVWPLREGRQHVLSLFGGVPSSKALCWGLATLFSAGVSALDTCSLSSCAVFLQCSLSPLQPLRAMQQRT